MPRAAFAPLALLALAACATPSNIIQPTKHANDPLAGFSWCLSFGCSDLMMGAKVAPAAWDEIAGYFQGTRDAADERDRIARAISRFEQIAGEVTGTKIDEGGTGMLPTRGIGQIDCYAEAANTTVALQMMLKAGFLKFHTVADPTMRGIPFGTPNLLVHATATIAETATGRLWAVDTWFYDNGGPTFVIDRDEWIAGWAPEGGTHI